MWRSIVAQRQTAAAQRQVELSERDSLDRQFQSAIEMLGHDSITVRLGGVHCLHLLSQKHLKTHGAEIRDVFIAFAHARNPSNSSGQSDDERVHTALGGRFSGPIDYVSAAACAKLLDTELKAAGIE